MSCLVCGDVSEGRSITATERMFGLGGEYRYRECPACGSLQLFDPPADLAPFYPSDYYSYGDARRPRLPALHAFLMRRRARAVLGDGDALGRLLRRRYGDTPRLGWMRSLDLGFDARILDVGCGDGALLRELQRDGFHRLTGADPFLERDLDCGGGLTIHRRALGAMEGTWDLIMLHHALEHTPDPHAVFAELGARTEPGGRLLIRVPVADCEARRRYADRWVQLDAPRHLVLFSRRGLVELAAEYGFRSLGVEDDATAFQFWGSELYVRDLPLRESGRTAPAWEGRFDASRMEAWESEAAALNAEGAGDQSVFFFERS